MARRVNHALSQCKTSPERWRTPCFESLNNITRQSDTMLYSAYSTLANSMAPWQALAKRMATPLLAPQDEYPWLRQFGATLETWSHLQLSHRRPSYGISEVLCGDEQIPVVEEVCFSRPFGNLLHFRKLQPDPSNPRVLLVAPLSGHFATLLRDTVKTLLQDHDVYITDWNNARDIPLSEGDFGLDDYIEYMIDFIAWLGPGVHVVAVCQPCVAALASVAIMAEDDHIAQPRSLTLMAGPVDCRINPTEVNKLATTKPITWFEQNLISHVPWNYSGAMRRVYPGFLQLFAFMSMNPERHKEQFLNLRDHLAQGRIKEANTIEDFYLEYFAVNDLPAAFYLETVSKVFQTYDLPKGELTYRGRLVNPGAIRRTALMTVEGERDDVCAVGQTVAAQDLCTSVRPAYRDHLVQTGVGHYGVFSGRKWNQQIYPRVRQLIYSRAA